MSWYEFALYYHITIMIVSYLVVFFPMFIDDEKYSIKFILYAFITLTFWEYIILKDLIDYIIKEKEVER